MVVYVGLGKIAYVLDVSRELDEDASVVIFGGLEKDHCGCRWQYCRSD